MPGQGSRIDFVTGAPEKYAHLVDALSTIPGKVRAAVAGASYAALRQEPADGGWSAVRNLAHLAYIAEANDVFLHQIAKMTSPARKDFPVGVIAEDLEALPVSTLLQRIDDAFGRTVELLGHTPDAAWGRPGEVRGMRRSLRQMAVAHIDHFEEHIVTLAALAGAKAGAGR
ncbi:MAG: DinB family protein [Chloroflexi bacterium]|nr:DinB family protein [Chloroflexota bacterium]